MGGDRAPAAILKGCWEAAALLEASDQVLLVGDERISREGLESSGLSPEKRALYRIIPSTQVIEMDDSPVEAIRGKPKSSINVMCNLRQEGEADVVISAPGIPAHAWLPLRLRSTAIYLA